MVDSRRTFGRLTFTAGDRPISVISQDAWNALPPDRQNELSQSVVRALDWLSDDQDTAKPIGIHWDTWRTH